MIPENPSSIGRYQVIHRLGVGAMGAVYLCQDPLLKRRVAVKIVLKTHAEAETMISRFQRESEISAQLNHPNIITVFDVGNDPEVGPFITMEFVEGGSLADLLVKGSLEPPAKLELLVQLGLALAAAERAGVVHRDIKPENILIGKDGKLKLTDFGLARDEVSNLTATGAMLGTPTHTAPELLQGARATPVTDRWAFSVTAFQLVLGQLPHSGDTLSALLHHIDREPPNLPEETPPALARVFLKALHQDPARRYGSILAFLAALAEAMGLQGKLVAKGLEVIPPPSLESETVAMAVPHSPSETECIEVPGPKPQTGDRAGTSSPSFAARLTGPPAGLIKGGQDASDPVPMGGMAYRVTSQRLAVPRKLAARTARPAPSSGTPGMAGGILLVLLAVLGAAGFYYWPRSLQIQTTPPGARILLDGKEVGVSPVKGTVSFGSHNLVASLMGYDSVSRAVHSSEGALALDLQPLSAWVDILTEPPGAQARLGGRALGSTPSRAVRVPEKSLPLVISMKGYTDWEGILGPGHMLPSPIVLQRENR